MRGFFLIALVACLIYMKVMAVDSPLSPGVADVPQMPPTATTTAIPTRTPSPTKTPTPKPDPCGFWKHSNDPDADMFYDQCEIDAMQASEDARYESERNDYFTQEANHTYPDMPLNQDCGYRGCYDVP